jgi:hypothetical protein
MLQFMSLSRAGFMAMRQFPKISAKIQGTSNVKATSATSIHIFGGAHRRISTTTSRVTIPVFTPTTQSSVAHPRHVKGDIATVAVGIAAGMAVLGVGKIWWDASSSATVSKEKLIDYFTELAYTIENLVVRSLLS